jgi:hypothetical protein
MKKFSEDTKDTIATIIILIVLFGFFTCLLIYG